MAPRVTPATALDTIRRLSAELASASRDAGQLSAAPTLTASIERLTSALAKPALQVDVLCGDASASALDSLARVLSPRLTGVGLAEALSAGTAIDLPATPATCALRFLPSRARRIEKAGAIRSPILVIACPTPPDDTFAETAIAAAADRPLVLLAAADPSTAAAVGASAWSVEVLSLAREQATLEDRIGSPPLAGAVDLLVADGAARAVESTAAALAAALDQELRGLTARRTLARQTAEPVQPGTSRVSELLAEVRARLQRQFAEFTRGLDDRRTAAFAPLAGEIWQRLDEALGRLTDLASERRTKTSAVSVPPAFEEHWLSSAREQISAHCLSDLAAMRDVFTLAGTEIDEALASAGGPPVVVSFQYLAEERLNRLLSLHLVMQRRYSGEVPRPGAFEYLMLARRYQMILFMFISALGLSFIRTYQQIMLPLAVVLLSFGALNVANTVRRERAEVRDREIEKAREVLRSELRRMLSEVLRGWTSLVSQHLTDQVAAATTQIESLVREHHARGTQAVADERARLQRQLQGVESLERRLLPAARARDALAQAVASVRGELRQLLLPVLRSPARTG